MLKYSRRPFRDLDEMHSELVRRWNEVVTDRDTVYHLGDFALGKVDLAIEVATKLRGHKHIVWGNHDKHLRKNAKFLALFESNADLKTVKLQDPDAPDGIRRIVLCHFPLLTWDRAHYGSWATHGHSHGNLPDDPHAFRVDVGVDCWDYRPVSYEQLKQRMAGKSFRPVDHHGISVGEDRGEE